MALPGTALVLATSQELKFIAKRAGDHALKLVEMNIKSSQSMTIKAFENAIMVHAGVVVAAFFKSQIYLL